MPKPGSGRGYAAAFYVKPLVLMLNGGGRSLEDLRTVKSDMALSSLLRSDTLPSTDAMGDWLHRTGGGAGMAGLSRLNRRIVATRIRQTRHTLDCDASQIVAESVRGALHLQGRARLHADDRPSERGGCGDP